jgi:tetratricopeptide (TPR) repeat protein
MAKKPPVKGSPLDVRDRATASATVPAPPQPLETKEQLRREKLARLTASVRRQKRDGKPSLALVIGAGVSLGAGIPLTRGWVPLLWRLYFGEKISKADVRMVLQTQQKGSISFKAYGSEYQRAAERVQNEVIGYKESWLLNHPKHHVDEYQCIMNSLSPVDQQRAVASILKACEPIKITWTYLRIAQLVKAGYVDSILTTNLDSVLIKALSLFDVIPAICDFHPAAELRSSHAGEPQVIYLHGNQHSYNVKNTQLAVANYTEPLPELLRSIAKDRTILVSGYAGWKDGLMQVLKERYPENGLEPPNELFWAFHSELPATLPLKNPHAHYIPNAPCDTLFDELCRELELLPPPLVENPLTYFVNLLNQIDADTPQMSPYKLKEKIAQIVSAETSQGEAVAYHIVTAAQSGKYRKAKALVDEWLAHNKHISSEGIVRLAGLLPHRGERAGTLEADLQLHLLTAASKRPQLSNDRKLLRARAEALYRIGRRLSLREDWEQATSTYRAIVNICPKHRDAWLFLGEALYGIKNYPASIDAYRKQTEIAPKHPFAWNNLGVSLDKNGDQDAAIAAYRKQVKVNPASDRAWNNLGVDLDSKGKETEALRAYKQQVKVDPRNQQVWNNIGIILYRRNNTIGAIKALLKQIEVSPKHNNAWNRLGLAYKRSGNLEGAIHAYRTQLDIYPQHDSARSNLALALWKAAQLDEAAKELATLLKKQPDDVSSLSNDAELSVVRGDMKRFQKRYKKLLSLKKLSDDTLVVMSFLHWLSPLNGPVDNLLKVLERRKTEKKVDWGFSEIMPYVAKLPTIKRRRAKALIKFFQGQLSRTSLLRALSLHHRGV